MGWLTDGVLIAVVGALGAWAVSRFGQARPFQNPREEIERDLKILPQLEPESDARAELKSSIEKRVVAMVKPVKTSRNWSEFFATLVLLASCGAGAVRFATWGGWWWVAAVPLALLAIFCFSPLAESLRKAERTQGGSLS